MLSSLLSLVLSCQTEAPEPPPSEPPKTEDIIQQRIESGGPLFSLDLTQAERLLDILKPASERPIHLQAFHIDSVNGEYILYKDKKSATMDKLMSLSWSDSEELIFVHAQNERRQQFHVFDSEWKSSPEFVSLVERINLGTDKFLVHLRQPDQYQLMAFDNGTFIEGPTFESLASTIQLSDGTLILHLKQDESHELYAFDGQQFQKLTAGKSISRLELSPDNKTYTYIINKDRQSFYGIGDLNYTRPPVWKAIGEAYAYLGVDDMGEQVFVDYKALGRFERISNFSTFSDDSQLHFIGSQEGAYTLHHVGTSLKNQSSPSYTRPPSLYIHQDTQELYWLGQSDSGIQLGLIQAGELKLSDSFEKINLESRVKNKQLPIATAMTSDKNQHVLMGTRKGPAFERIERLQSMQKNSGIVYVGLSNDQYSLVQNDSAGEKFDKIHSIGLTKASEKVYCHASIAENHHFIYESNKSPAVQKINRITPSRGDDVAWQGEKSDSVHIGLNAELYDGFDSIQSIQFSPHNVLWYDAKRESNLFRGIKDTVLGPFTSMGRPLYSSLNHSILFAARHGTSTESTVSLTDVVYKNSQIIQQYDYSMANDSTAQRRLSSADLPKIHPFSDSDSFYMLAELPETVFVGLNQDKWGPFEDVKFVKRWPEQEKIVFAAKKDDKWSALVNGSSRDEVDDITNLGFTKDLKKLLYDVKIAGEKFVYVGSDRYQSIRYEKLTPHGDAHTFQGKKDDKWLLVVDDSKSLPFLDLGPTLFTPDSYGIEAIARDSSGKKLIQKLFQKDFEYSDTFDSLGSTQYYHFPLKAYAARKIADAFTESELEAIVKGEYEGPLWLQLVDDDDNVISLAGLDKDEVFLSVTSSLSRISNGYRIVKIDEENNRFVLDDLTKLNDLRQSYTTRPMILRLHDRPFVIRATHDRKSGVVHSNRFFTRLESPHLNYFTENGFFHAIGRGETYDYFIVNHTHSAGLNRIQGLSYSDLASDQDLNRLALLTSNEDRNNPWHELVLIDNNLEIEKIDGASRIETERVRRRTTFEVQTPLVDWIKLAGRTASTIIWQGESHREFFSVHNSRYDSISDAYRTSDGLLEFYMGHRNGLSSIYTDGAHHPWYTQITDVSHSASGAPIYLAHQLYQHAASHERSVSNVTTFKANRRLTRLVHGDATGPWQDKIHSLIPHDQFDSSVYVGVRDAQAQLYIGSNATFEAYDDIGWLHLGDRVNTPSETETASNASGPKTSAQKASELIPGQSIHFLARKGDQWMEVHNGQESNPFDGLERLNLANDYPESYTELSHDGRLNLPKVYIDAQNRYFYRAQMGEKDAIIHQGQQSDTVEGLQEVWLFNDGELMTFNNVLPEGQQVYAAGALSEMYLNILPPLYQPYSQSINFIAVLSAPETIDISTEQWHQFDTIDALELYLEENEIESDGNIFDRVTLLHNIAPTASAWDVDPIIEEDGVPAVQLWNEDGSRIWMNGQEGPVVDSINADNAYWGASLEDSRYAVTFENQKYIAGSSLKHGPFDAISSMQLLDLESNGSWIWTGQIGNVQQLYVNDALYDSAHRFFPNREISNGLLTYTANQAHNVTVRRGEDRFNDLDSFTLESIDTAMLRIEDAGQNWIEYNDLVSEKSDIFYFLHHVEASDTEGEKLIWLGGILNQEQATLDIQLFELLLTSPPASPPIRELEELPAVADAEE